MQVMLENGSTPSESLQHQVVGAMQESARRMHQISSLAEAAIADTEEPISFFAELFPEVSADELEALVDHLYHDPNRRSPARRRHAED